MIFQTTTPGLSLLGQDASAPQPNVFPGEGLIPDLVQQGIDAGMRQAAEAAAAAAALEAQQKRALEAQQKLLYKQPWFWVTVIGSVIGSVAVLGGGYVLMRRRYAPLTI